MRRATTDNSSSGLCETRLYDGENGARDEKLDDEEELFKPGVNVTRQGSVNKHESVERGDTVFTFDKLIG